MKAESFLLQSLKSGESFYTEKDNSHMTALSAYYNRKITTRKIIAQDEDRVVYLTKVTVA